MQGNKIKKFTGSNHAVGRNKDEIRNRRKEKVDDRNTSKLKIIYWFASNVCSMELLGNDWKKTSKSCTLSKALFALQTVIWLKA